MPKIKNKTKKTVLSENVEVCKSIFSKSIGLMFSKKKRSLVFVFDREKIIPLHMLMVFYPIDVLFLNKNKEVVEMKENFRPFTFYTPKSKALYIIELPQGMIKKTKTKAGDKIGFNIKNRKVYIYYSAITL
ncbi:DUF192 domain-containing protein [Candidatus Woesearchaeota archaeon]|nr:DUF192 domain-containing protein [Candidatus Woesearchaeota archaeon]